MKKYLLWTAFLVLGVAIIAYAAWDGATNFPGSLDDSTSLYDVSDGDTIQPEHHDALAQAIIAIETKLGTGTTIGIGTATPAGMLHTVLVAGKPAIFGGDALATVTGVTGTDASPTVLTVATTNGIAVGDAVIINSGTNATVGTYWCTVVVVDTSVTLDRNASSGGAISAASVTYVNDPIVIETSSGAGEPRIVLPLQNDGATPTLGFGDGDTGIYEESDGILKVVIEGNQKWGFGSVAFGVTSSTYPVLRYEACSTTNPNLLPNSSDLDSGIGQNAVDQLSLIAGGVEGIRIVEDTTISVHLPETTTPTPIANYGAIYPKADNLLYFQDGDGIEHTLSETDTDYGEMYLNANAVATTIETAATPIALRLFTTGSLNDWTFDAGSTAAITVYADYSGTVAGTVLATSTHGLTTGDIISIRGTTNYNGIFQVTVTDGTHFYFTDTWVNDNGASDFDQPSHLIAGANAAGKYAVSWNMSSSAGTGNDTFLFAIYNNTTVHATSRVDRKFANNDIGAFGGCGIITVAVGDWIFLTATNDGTGTITNAYGALVINRL